MDNIRNDLSERGLSGEDAQDRVNWRKSHKKRRCHIKVGKDAEEEEMDIPLTPHLDAVVAEDVVTPHLTGAAWPR